MKKIRIISCNLRFQTVGDGEQQFINRIDFLCQRLLQLDADVIGFQEIKPQMRKMIITRMPGYALLGAGRDKYRLDEGTVIAYKQAELIPERLISDILSPTPHIPGTTYGIDQSTCPRIFSSCDFMPIDGGKPFRVMNIHTDHIGKQARLLEVEQLLASYKEQQSLRPMTTFITGDFNALPDAPEIKLITESGIFRDISSELGGTFHGFGKCDPKMKIDYIFADCNVQVLDIFAPHDVNNGIYFSDHDPIVATVVIPD